MKKFLAGVLIGMCAYGYCFGCGGMTQIDPPSLQLDAGPANNDVDTAADDLQGIVVLC